MGWLLETGRFGAIVAWAFFFATLLVMFHYKHRRINKKFLLILPLGLCTLLSHISVFVVLSIFYAGLFLVKNLKERLIMILSYTLIIFLSSFWLVPFLTKTVDPNWGLENVFGLHKLLSPKIAVSYTHLTLPTN